MKTFQKESDYWKYNYHLDLIWTVLYFAIAFVDLGEIGIFTIPAGIFSIFFFVRFDRRQYQDALIREKYFHDEPFSDEKSDKKD